MKLPRGNFGRSLIPSSSVLRDSQRGIYELGDFNGHVGKDCQGYEDVPCGWGFGEERGGRVQINYLLVRRQHRKECRNFWVLPSESSLRPHQLLVLGINIPDTIGM